MSRMYLVTLLLTCLPLMAADRGNGRNSDASYRRLMEGHQRYIDDAPINAAGTLDEKRKDLSTYQAPIAIVVSCSDSRVPPEIIFDQNLGDLFVVRVAGNVVGPVEMDSIEYAVVVLKAPLIMVLGHENCGAVEAVMSGKAEENELEAIVPYLKNAISQAAKLPGDPLTNAVKENVKITMQRLARKSELKEATKNKQLKIVGGYYQLESGKIEPINY